MNGNRVNVARQRGSSPGSGSRPPASKAVKAATSLQAATLSSLGPAVLYANGGNFVVYGEQGKVYSWNGILGISTLRVETAPAQVFIAGGAMVFTVNSAVYRVVLQ